MESLITIYDKLGKELLEVPITRECTRKRVLMGDNYVLLIFNHDSYVDFRKGSYIMYKSFKFEIMTDIYPERNKGGWRYSLQFDAKDGLLRKYNIFYRKQGVEEVAFALTTNLLSFGNVISDCINHELGGTNWRIKDIPSEFSEIMKTLSFKGEKLFDALTMIAEQFECEWWVEENGEFVDICFGKLLFGTEEEFEEGNVVTSIPRKAGDDSDFGTRFFVFGSTRNLTSDYGQVEQGGTTNHISEVRLRLPGGMNYIDAWDNLAPEDVVQQVAFFDDIYPKNTDVITNVETVPRSVEGSDKTFDAYVITAANTPFVPSDMIEGETLGCVFETGSLQGQSFELAINYDPKTWKPSDNFDKKFEIIHVMNGDIIIPNESFKPTVGDKFIITGVKLPEKRIKEAEQELLKAGQAWAQKNSKDTSVYDCPSNPVFCQINEKNYDLGQKVKLVGDRFGAGGRSSRIQSFEKKLWNEYEATYTVGDNSLYSRLNTIEGEIKESQYSERIGAVKGTGIYLIRDKFDNTQPTNYNAYSALATLEKFVTRVLFFSYLNQPVKTDSDVRFKSVTSPTDDWFIKQLGDAKFRDILGRVITITDRLMTDNFVAGMTGVGVGVVNKSEVHMDKAVVRKYLEVLALVVSQMFYRGGRQVLSPAGMKINRVEEFDGYWRCYMETEDGQKNEFTVGAQARCNRYSSNQRYWWCLVMGIGLDYIDVSKTDMDEGSMAPEVGDEVVQFGHRTDPYLQWVVMDSSFSDDAGRTIYAGVDGYDLSGKWVLREGVSPTDPSRIGLFTKHGEFSDVIDGLNKEISDTRQEAQDAQNSANAIQEIVNNLTSIIIPDLQNQVDGAIQSWDGEVEPTLNNYPANEWETDIEKNRHINDTYDYYFKDEEENTVSARYKFRNINGVYSWERLSDTQSAATDAKIRELFGIVGTKNSINYGNRPIPPYIIDDIWIKEDGSMYACVKARLKDESGMDTDWRLFNDTMLRLIQIASDNVISKEEKPSLRDTWSQIQKEFTKYQADATTYGVAITNLQNSYNALGSFLTNTVKLAQDVDTALTVSQKADFNQKFADYYAQRTAFANLVAQKVVDGAVANVQIGGTNLISYFKENGIWWEDSTYDKATGVIKGQSRGNAQYPRVFNRSIAYLVLDLNSAYTISFKIRSNKTTSRKFNISDTNGANYILPSIQTGELSSEWKEVKQIFRPVRQMLSTSIFQVYMGDVLVDPPYDSTTWIELKDVKLEKGNKATDFSYSLPDQQVVAREQGQEVVDKIQIGVVNLLKKSNVELNVQAYQIGKYAYDAFPQEGTTYTAVICYTLGTNNTYIGVYTNSGTGSIRQLSKKGNKVIESFTFTAPVTPTGFFDFYQFPNGTYGSTVHWAVLVEGNKASNSWIPPLSEQGEEAAKNEVENLQIGSVNLISRKMLLDWNNAKDGITKWGQDSNGIYLSVNPSPLYLYVGGSHDYNDIFENKVKYKANTRYVFSIEWKTATTEADSKNGLYLYISYTDGTDSRFFTASNQQTTKTRTDFITDKGKTVQKIYCSYGYLINCFIYSIGLIEGNKIPTEIPTAMEDLQGQSNVNLQDNSKFQFGLEGYGANQDVTLNIVNGILQVRSSQTTSTPGVRFPKVHLKSGVYTVKIRSKSINCRSGIYIYTKDLAVNVASADLKFDNALFADNEFTFAIPTEGDYRVISLWSAPTATAYPAGFDIEYSILTAGFISPADWNPSPEDVQKDIKDVSNAILNLNTTINTTFKDGIISEAEAKAIASNINVLNSEKADIDAAYLTVWNSPYLFVGTAAADNFKAAKTAYNTAHTKLIDSINTAIADGKTTAAEKADVDKKFEAYSLALSTYTTRLEEANRAIQDRLKALAEQDTTNKVDNIQVGGTNLFPISKLNNVSYVGSSSKEGSGTEIIFKCNAPNAWAILPVSIPTPLVPINTDFVISMDIRNTNNFGYEVTATSGTPTLISRINFENTTSEWKRVYKGFNSGSKANIGGVNLWGVGDVRHIKIEVGNKATDWSPAPEDVQHEVDTINDKLTTWASDGYISPQEKTGLRQQKSDIQAEYSDIVTNTNRYNVSTTSYTTAYNAAIAALNKYTAVTPENIAVGADYSNISAYYAARQTTLNSIAIVVKVQTDTAMAKMLFKDPEFRKGTNSVGIYNNSSNGTVTVTRIAKPSDAPTDSSYCLQVKTAGTASPGFGGVVQSIQSRANAVFIQKIIAKIPIGYTITAASNSMGTGYSDTWLTFRAGTGKYETYLRKVVCGASGSFSSGGHVYITGSPTPTSTAPLIWYIAYMTCFDLMADGYTDIIGEAETGNTKTRDDFAKTMGFDNFQKYEEFIAAKGSITQANLIRADLINVKAIAADKAFISNLIAQDAFITNIEGSSFNFKKGTFGGFTAEANLLFSGKKFGVGAGIAMQSMINNYGFNVYKDTSNYVEMFYRGATDWGLKGVASGNNVFQLGSTNKVGPFNFTKDELISNVTVGSDNYDMRLAAQRIVFTGPNGQVLIGNTSGLGGPAVIGINGGDFRHQAGTFYASKIQAQGDITLISGRNFYLNGNLITGISSTLRLFGQLCLMPNHWGVDTTLNTSSCIFQYLSGKGQTITIPSGLQDGTVFIITGSSDSEFFVKLSGSEKFKRNGKSYSKIKSNYQDWVILCKVSSTSWSVTQLPVNWITWYS